MYSISATRYSQSIWSREMSFVQVVGNRHWHWRKRKEGGREALRGAQANYLLSANNRRCLCSMQAFRRLYSTLPDAAAAARTASTPRAVRLRRLRKRPAVAPGQSDATTAGLTPSEEARYQRELAKGELAGEDGRYLTEAEWLERLDSRRTRIRGVREVVSKDGEKENQVVGQKIYLPNVILRMVRNHTPPGEPYNPYEATFRVPQSLTKTDIRSYLSAVYGVKTTYIRTDNYLAKLHTYTKEVKKPSYKRAVVGLTDPFYFPQTPEDMTTEERETRQKRLEETFAIATTDSMRKHELLRMSRQGAEGWRWRTGVTAKRSNIIRLIAERRAAREDAVLEMKNRLQASRETV